MKSLTPKQIASKLVKTKSYENVYYVCLADQMLYSTTLLRVEAFRKRLKRKILKTLEAFLMVDIETAAGLLVSVRTDSHSMHEVYVAGELVDSSYDPRSTLRNRWKRKISQILAAAEKAKG